MAIQIVSAARYVLFYCFPHVGSICDCSSKGMTDIDDCGIMLDHRNLLQSVDVILVDLDLEA